ncbi:hypothetical protein Q2B95_04570 [Stenotrophomonas maltophilia]|uniref:hypothetical protein n=1 Tax=Stenotrophomonas maltophilia TaxID=40324 RepID=UPI003099808F
MRAEGTSKSSTTIWLMLWGWMDIIGLASMVGANVYQGRVPFLSDISDAIKAQQMYGSAFPVIVSAVSVALLASFVASGYLLIKGRNAGRHLAFIQSPFRIILFMPSLFFLEYTGVFSQYPWALVAALVLTELAKLWSIRRRPASN